MKFNRYNSLTNAYMISDIEKMRDVVGDSCDWVVTEKIHGSNFQVKGVRDSPDANIEFRIGKRSGFTDLNFFGLHSSEPFVEQYAAVNKMIGRLMTDDPSIDSITVYGEVYGGNIQKGIFYSTFKRFIAFDLLINDGYIPYKESLDIFDEYNIDRVKVLKTGSFEECLDYPNTFNSHIPELLHEESPEENVCEGVVIRPNIPHYLSSGSFVVIKNKNSKWLEKSKVAKKSKQKELSEDDLKIYNELSSRINENRVSSAISKYGREMKYIPDILKETLDDITSETSIEFKEFELNDLNRIRRSLSKRIVDLIKKDIMSQGV